MKWINKPLTGVQERRPMAFIPQVHKKIFGSVRLKLRLLKTQSSSRPQLLRDTQSLEDLAVPPDEDVIRDDGTEHVE